MNKRQILALHTVFLATFFAFAGNVMAGNNAEQKARAGFFCFNGGPNNWTHCLRAEKFGYPSVPVKVFSESGEDFLGTELLLRYDIYSGQPCSQDGGDTWHFLPDDDPPGPPYYACHHFGTSHD